MDGSGEVVYRRAGEAIEVLHEGDAEAQYVCRPVYEVYRRDEPSQAFEPMETGELRSFEEAVAACVIDANAVAAERGMADAFDGGLSFRDEVRGRTSGWFAREWDTIGSDWQIGLEGYVVWDQVNGGDEVRLGSEDELPAFIRDEIDRGWF